MPHMDDTGDTGDRSAPYEGSGLGQGLKATDDPLKRNLSGVEPEGPPSTDLKFDHGKPRMDLIPWTALEAVGRVLEFGARKYEPDSWMSVKNAPRRYRAAMLRHYASMERGEMDDPESGLPHVAHLACNALFITALALEASKEPCDKYDREAMTAFCSRLREWSPSSQSFIEESEVK